MTKGIPHSRPCLEESRVIRRLRADRYQISHRALGWQPFVRMGACTHVPSKPICLNSCTKTRGSPWSLVEQGYRDTHQTLSEPSTSGKGKIQWMPLHPAQKKNAWSSHLAVLGKNPAE